MNRVRLHQGRPRGAARPRRHLHERHRRDDRSRRLADDLLPHPRRPAVLLRHLLPQTAVPATAGRGRPTPGATGATRSSRPPSQIAGELRRMAAGHSRRRAGDHRSRCAITPSRPSCATRTPRAAGSVARRSSRPRRCWRRCCAPTSAPRSPVPLAAVRRTCEAMARGGIYDQLAGGFARYSVDADWVVPHFEKMLYDNALLLRVYAHWARRTGDPLARRVAAETAAFLIDDLAERRHVHLVAGRRRRRSRGLHLRVDAADNCAKSSAMTTAIGRQRFSRSPTQGTLRARDIGAATARRSR